jgi:hypothetical protein
MTDSSEPAYRTFTCPPPTPPVVASVLIICFCCPEDEKEKIVKAITSITAAAVTVL